MLRKILVYMLGIGVALVFGGLLVSVQWRREAIMDGQYYERSPLSTLLVVLVMTSAAASTMRLCWRRWGKEKGAEYQSARKGDLQNKL